MIYRQVSQGSPIELNVLFLQGCYKPAVKHSAGSECCIDTRNPEAPNFSFVCFAMAGGVLQRVIDRDFRPAELGPHGSAKTLRPANHLFSSATRNKTSFYSYHFLLPSRQHALYPGNIRRFNPQGLSRGAHFSGRLPLQQVSPA